MITIDELAARYVAVWNEPDMTVRDAAVTGVFPRGTSGWGRLVRG
ncbi:MAG TPA: hypothetical protein VIZ43_15890 [Trebonia sp.]